MENNILGNNDVYLGVSLVDDPVYNQDFCFDMLNQKYYAFGKQVSREEFIKVYNRKTDVAD
jgi:hypothetical protein